MDESRDTELVSLLNFSQRMLGLAQNSDWEEFSELEIKRTEVMHSFFESSALKEGSIGDSDKIEQTIKKVLLINEQIEKLAQKEKITISQQLHSMKQKQNVHSAYLENK